MPRKKERDYLNGRVVEIMQPRTYVGMSCDFLPKKTIIKMLKQRLKELKDGKRTW